MPETRNWLPFGMNSAALDWSIMDSVGPRRDIPWSCPIGCTWHLVRAAGTQAYAFGMAPDGRVIHIRAYHDGVWTQTWWRDPIDGIWPGTYHWQRGMP